MGHLLVGGCSFKKKKHNETRICISQLRKLESEDRVYISTSPGPEKVRNLA